MQPYALQDARAPIAFPDGRVFEFQEWSCLELDENERIYRLNLELMEHSTQHLHHVQVTIYWKALGSDERPPDGNTLLHVTRKHLIPEMATWRYPERLSSLGTFHAFNIGRENDTPI